MRPSSHEPTVYHACAAPAGWARPDRGVYLRARAAPRRLPGPILAEVHRHVAQDPDQPPVDDRLWDQYKNAADEYRFQHNLNWNRSQYFFVLNLAWLVVLLRLAPGRYEASALTGARVCDVKVSITTALLQPLIVRC